MNKKEVEQEVAQRLARGESKAVVFDTLSAQGANVRVLAYTIAAYAAPELREANAGYIKALVVIAWIQCAIAALFGLAMVSRFGMLTGAISTIAMVAFAYLFVWGFSHHKIWAYQLTIIFAIVNFPKQLIGFAETPVATSIGLLISMGLVAFTVYVRGKVFPDFSVMAPRKVNGEYAFSS